MHLALGFDLLLDQLSMALTKQRKTELLGEFEKIVARFVDTLCECDISENEKALDNFDLVRKP